MAMVAATSKLSHAPMTCSCAGGLDLKTVTTFCSESWEWKFSSLGVRPLSVELPFLPSTAPYIGVSNAHSTSLAGKLFWKTTGAQVAVYDPFSDQRLPFKLIDCSHLWSNDIANNNFLIGVSQGYLRGMVFPRPGRVHSKGFFHCWKLEEDKSVVGGYRWSFDYNVSMRMVYNIIVPQLKLNKIGGRRRMRLGVLGVHPSKPEVIYFECHDHSKKHNHDPFFFDFRHHFRVNDGSLKPDHNYDPIYVVPFDVVRHKVVGEIIPIAESNETHLRFKMWGMFGVDDPIGWAVFQPAIPFWPTPIPVPDFANEVVEEEPEDVDESHMYENAFRYLVW
ncbi:unnamed protein product [Linum trigynum]|uniref:Uncharacterized protein n=1 Tax=Linum trigynum TaxID=586398 RepID=A0AAV2E5S7_9ROSI